jgi:hypothetical protein
MVWHTHEERFLGVTIAGDVRIEAGNEALQNYLDGMPDLKPDGRFLMDFLIAKIISLAFFPAFEFWRTPADKQEGLTRVEKTIVQLEEIAELEA